MAYRRAVFGREPWINTIIGGVAGSISSKSALATKLVISESIIKRFEIVGSDVRAFISSKYRFTTESFKNDSVITSYEDLSGYFDFEFTHETLGPSANQFNGSNIRYANLPHQKKLPNGIFWDSKLEILNSPNLTEISNSMLLNCTFLHTFNHGIIVSVDNFGLRYINITPDVSNVSFLGNDSISNTKYTSLNFTALVNITSTAPMRNIATVVTADFPVLESITNFNSFFNGWTSATRITMKKCKMLGTDPTGGTTNNAKGFVNLKSGCTIEVNVNQLTINSGSPHGALVWAKANRAAIVKFYDDAGNYVSTL